MNSINEMISSKYSFGTKFDYAFYTDILGVYHDVRKVAKLEPLLENETDSIIEFLKGLGLKYIKIKRSETFNETDMIFNKDIITNDGIDLFISKENLYLDLITKIYNNPKSKKSELIIGKLLGYPDCCIKSFLSNNYINDKIYDNYLNNKTIGSFDWRLNNTLSIYRLIPFFPCSYNCKEAIKYAQKQFDIMPNNHNLYKLLNSMVLYDNFWNYIVLIGGRIDSKSLNYDDIILSEHIDKDVKNHIENNKYLINGKNVIIGNIDYSIFDFFTENNI